MRTAVFASALAAAIVLTPTAAAAGTAKDPFPVDSNGLGGLSAESVNYGHQRNQDMDVWWTADGTKRPGVFLIHGGWWSGGDKKYMTEIARTYADMGYTVFNLNYRLSGQQAWPAQRSDAFSAIAVARKHAERWSYDPANFVVVGFSAGGHIAAAVGTYGNGVPGLKGVVGLSPVISPLRAYSDGAKTADINKRRLRLAAMRLAGGCEPKGKCSRVWASMEVPWHASAKDAPMLMLHSQDEFVPPVQSQLLKTMLGQVGVDVTVVTQPGAEHSAPLFREPGVAERVQQWISERIG
ncbi:alpha/beta hydrolase [Nonomuraea sp. NPDC050790]|uniref:alpha/beta hydrolase n=1 Tax=Nonomuraea sp. NPDC050790 TaxID=3364371 RepID=UPI0037901120